MSSDCSAAIGRGNEIVCFAIEQIAKRIVGLDLAPIFADMGKFWDFCKPSIFYNNKIETNQLTSFLKWCLTLSTVGSDLKRVSSILLPPLFPTPSGICTPSMPASPCGSLSLTLLPKSMCPHLKLKKKKLTVKKRFVKATSFRYITDALTPAEALDILKSKESGKAAREAEVKKRGYPAYTTSVGWLGYSDEKVRRLTKESLAQGFNHFKVSIFCLSHGPRSPFFNLPFFISFL